MASPRRVVGSPLPPTRHRQWPSLVSRHGRKAQLACAADHMPVHHQSVAVARSIMKNGGQRVQEEPGDLRAPILKSGPLERQRSSHARTPATPLCGARARPSGCQSCKDSAQPLPQSQLRSSTTTAGGERCSAQALASASARVNWRWRKVSSTGTQLTTNNRNLPGCNQYKKNVVAQKVCSSSRREKYLCLIL